MLTSVPGVASSILVRFQTMVEVDHEVIYSVIFLLQLIQKKVVVSYMRTYVHKGVVNRLVKLAQEKVWLDELTISHDHSC